LKSYSSIISRSIIVLVLAMLCNGAPAVALGPGGIVIFDPDPDHIWNRTYSCLFVRDGPDGSEYGSDTVDPLFWPRTQYLLTGKSHERAVACLDSFLRSHAERAIQDPLRRVILQHDLWALFDWAASEDDDGLQKQRRELETRLSEAIRRLALTSEQFRTLPDTYEATVAARAFAPAYDSQNRQQPFLPPDLFRPDGPWVCLSARSVQPTAILHFTGRSRFLVFMKLPQGRDTTLAYTSKLRSSYEPLIRNEPGLEFLNLTLPQFPVGTEVALVRQMIGLDTVGKLVPTRLTESVQIRVYHAITPGTKYMNYINGPSSHDQDFFEFQMRRQQLFAGQGGGLLAMTPNQTEFATFSAHGFDPFEESSPLREQGVVLQRCPACHADSGIHSVQSRLQWMQRQSNREEPKPDPNTDPVVWETSVTAAFKENRREFKLLQNLWK